MWLIVCEALSLPQKALPTYQPLLTADWLTTLQRRVCNLLQKSAEAAESLSGILNWLQERINEFEACFAITMHLWP